MPGRLLLNRLGELLREFGLELVRGGGGSSGSKAADADSTCWMVTGALWAETFRGEGAGAGYSGASECDVIRFLTLDNLLPDSDEATEGDSLDSLDSAEPMEKSDESLRPALFLGAPSMVARKCWRDVYRSVWVAGSTRLRQSNSALRLFVCQF